MKRSAIKEAKQEANWFLKRVEQWQIMDDAREYRKDDAIWDHTKETAALKRASLDLTRALAQMRKP